MDNTGKATPPKRTRQMAGKRFAKTGQFATAGVATAGPVGKSRVKKAGGSLITTIPMTARKLAHVEDGQEMSFFVEGRKIIMEPVEPEKPRSVRRPRYTLDQLLEDYERGEMTDEEKAFHDAQPVGREVW